MTFTRPYSTQQVTITPDAPVGRSIFSQVQSAVYDVTRRDSFLGLDSWLQELEMYTRKNVVKMLVGNKIDEPDREVDRREGLHFARKHSMLFVEASAKMKDGVQSAFEEVVLRILQTPELWNVRKEGVKLSESRVLKEPDACHAYCSIA
uniref:Uncharacterized protein n=1 Tax=Varanus komodoensis TaxID=61221 RepID=A0A8D2IWX3_VARKO